MVLPRPRPYQAPVLASSSRRKVLAAGRRWGKSTIALVAALAGHGPIDPRTGRPLFRGALHGATIWWVVPDMPTTGRDRWRDLKRACRGVWVEKNEVEKRIVLPGGGSITIRSADDPDSLRGPSLDGVVLDEAALMHPDTWTEALRPALADYKGWALFLSTPKGRANWFYEVWTRGATLEQLAELKLDADTRREAYESWQRPSSENPLMDEAELADARKDTDALTFAQEYLAQFVVPTGKVFSRAWFRYYDRDGEVLTLDADSPVRVTMASLRRFATMDVAVTTKTTGDYTVVAVFGTTPQGYLVLLDLFRDRLEAPDLIPQLVQLRSRWALPYIGIEKDGIGLSVVQLARRRGIPVRQIKAEKDKVSRATTLVVRMENGEFFLPRSAPWLADLEAELLEFGDGQGHDDQVDALAYGAIEQGTSPSKAIVSS